MLTSHLDSSLGAVKGPDAFEDKAQLRVIATIRASGTVTMVLCFLSLILVVLISYPEVNHDTACWLYCARMVMKGFLPHVDYYHFNPPLQDYLHVGPVFMADSLGLNVESVFIWTILGAVAVGSLIVRKIVALNRVWRSLGAAQFVIALYCYCSVIANPPGSLSFGSREHLFVMALVPWILCRVTRYESNEANTVTLLLAGIVGCFAGPFFLLKPHFLAVAVLVETYMLCRRGSLQRLLDVEIITVIVIALAYVVHFVVILPSDVSNNFLRRWLPWVVASYSAYNCSASNLMQSLLIPRIVFPALLGTVLLTMSLAGRRRGPLWLAVECSLVAFLTSALVFVLQRKCWPYQLFPSLALGTMLVGLAAILGVAETTIVTSKRSSFLQLRRWQNLAVAVFLAACGFICVDCGRKVLSAKDAGLIPHISNEALLAVIRRQTQVDDRITFLSTSVDPVCPLLLRSGRQSGTRYLLLFPIPGFYLVNHLPVTDGQRVIAPQPVGSAPEGMFLREIGGEIGEFRPKLVLISTQIPCQGCPAGVSVDRYLHSRGWQHTYLNGYRKITELGEFSVYKFCGQGDH